MRPVAAWLSASGCLLWIGAHHPSPFFRGIITAVYWLSPAVYPYRIVTERDDALSWAQAAVVKRRSEHRRSA